MPHIGTHLQEVKHIIAPSIVTESPTMASALIDNYMRYARVPSQVKRDAKSALIRMLSTNDDENSLSEVFALVMFALERMSGSREAVLIIAACTHEFSSNLLGDEYINIFKATNALADDLLKSARKSRRTFGGIRVVQRADHVKMLYLAWGLMMHLIRRIEQVLGQPMCVRATSVIPNCALIANKNNIDEGLRDDLQVIQARHKKMGLPMRKDLIETMVDIVVLVECGLLSVATVFGISLSMNEKQTLDMYKGIVDGTQDIAELEKHYDQAIDKLDLTDIERDRLDKGRIYERRPRI